MDHADLPLLTLAGAARLIATGALSPVEYASALLARIDAIDPLVQAFIRVTPEHALAAARRAADEIGAGRHRGAMHGMPFALKDVFDTAGVTTTGGSRLFLDNVPVEHAGSAQRLVDAGGVLVGKLATHELASGGPSLDLPFPPARNPWRTSHFTGGSSSGPGAAVAAGLVPLALGSDTGGSIRIPAALCGIAGLKPTYGLVSRHGVMPNSWTFDHVGPMAWTAEDCALALEVIAGHDARDPASCAAPSAGYRGALGESLRGVRVGVVRHFWEEEGTTHPAMAAAMDRSIDVLRSLGASVADARMQTRQNYSDTMMVIAKVETVAAYRDDFRHRLADFGSDYVARTLPGLLFSGEDYVRAQRERRRLIAAMEPLYAQFDVLLTATSTPAAPLQQVMGAGAVTRWKDPSIYTPFNVTGGPALVVCNGYTADGLPLAMQIAGAPFADAMVLRVGHAYEQATTWRAVRPALRAGDVAPALTAPAREDDTAVDAVTRSHVDDALRRAGIAVSDAQRAILHRIAVPALAAAGRIAGGHPRTLEPASVFAAVAPARDDARQRAIMGDAPRA
jgi:aspartyl-tRNA(Asn)/glutamyl-tRNA(Gln) amidotransferase subunit A